ncbi:MAG TPA: cytochrome c oxidase subunit II [Longimicrobium sp.]|jgi:cytochrome c oxidase subunit 2
MLGAVALLLAAAPAAMGDAFTPEHAGGSRNADGIHTLFVIAMILGGLIFVLVEGVLITALIRFRRRRGGPEAAQIRGNTPLEIGWTLGAAAIIVALAVITFVYLGDIRTPEASKAGTVQVASLHQPKVPGGKALRVVVTGQQYLWRFEYPGKEQVFSYHDMYVPVGATVTLKIRSSDVAHSWWIPQLGGKADAIPGHTNDSWFQVDRPGTFYGECAELCGENHADMRARVIALPPARFQAWLRRQAADIREAQAQLSLSRKIRGEGS